MIVDNDTQIITNCVEIVVLAIETTVGKDSGTGVSGEAGLPIPLGVVLLTFSLLLGFFLFFADGVLLFGLLTLDAVLLLLCLQIFPTDSINLYCLQIKNGG